MAVSKPSRGILRTGRWTMPELDPLDELELNMLAAHGDLERAELAAGNYVRLLENLLSGGDFNA